VSEISTVLLESEYSRREEERQAKRDQKPSAEEALCEEAE
jgi:hypothetical protein